MKKTTLELFGDSGDLTLEQIILRIGVAAVIGLVIYVSYWLSHQGTTYSRKFNVTLLVLTVLTATVMTVIGNNIALSLGMVGALSIIRFRTAIKDSRDTAYIFWTIIVGICCGVGDYQVAAVGSTMVFVLLLLLGRIRSDSRILLIIRADRVSEQKVEALVFELFQRKASLRVKNTTPDSVEFIYELSRKMIEQAEGKGRIITNELYALGNIQYVNLVTQNDEISA